MVRGEQLVLGVACGHIRSKCRYFFGRMIEKVDKMRRSDDYYFNSLFDLRCVGVVL